MFKKLLGGGDGEQAYDRLADTLGWELPQDRYYPKAGQFLLKQGYR